MRRRLRSEFGGTVLVALLGHGAMCERSGRLGCVLGEVRQLFWAASSRHACHSLNG